MEVVIKIGDGFDYHLVLKQGEKIVNWDDLTRESIIKILYSFEWGKRTFNRHFLKSDKEG